MFALVKQAWEKEKLLSFTTAAAATTILDTSQITLQIHQPDATNYPEKY